MSSRGEEALDGSAPKQVELEAEEAEVRDGESHLLNPVRFQFPNMVKSGDREWDVDLC